MNNNNYEYWIILFASFLGALFVIFYSNAVFNEELKKESQIIAEISIVPRQKLAWVEFDFGDGKKRLFEGVVDSQKYNLKVALRAVADEGRFDYKVVDGNLRVLAGVGGNSGKWMVYRNSKLADVPLDKLVIAAGDHYTFRFEP